MKLKKLAALALSCAMVISGGALFAACGDDDKKDEGGKTGFVEDTRIWYAVGKDTKGTLKDQGWDQNNSTYAFTKDTTVTDENVFTLSLDIYAGNVGIGNSFKFLYKETADEANVPWTRQVGMQHLEGIEGSDADAVLKMNDVTVFTTAEDNGAYNNIALAKGQEGRYTFTLKTKSNTDMNPVISVKKESSITVNYDMYVIGDMNNYGASGKVEMIENVVDGAATTWTCKLEVKAAALYRNEDGTLAEDEDGLACGEYAAVCLLNDRDGKTFVPAAGEGVIIKEVKNFAGNKDYTCILLKEGKYNVVFTEDTTNGVSGSVAVTESAFDMYLIGSMNGWKQADEDYAMDEQADGSFAATIDVTKDMLTVENEDGTTTVNESIELKAFNAKGLTDADKYSAGANTVLTEGKWAIKYDPETNTIQVEKFGYWVVGTFDGANFAVKEGVTPKLEATETEGVYTCEYEITADAKTTDSVYSWLNDSVFALKAVYGTNLLGAKDWIGPADNPNGNVMISSIGKYVVTVTVTDGGASVAAKKAGAEDEATHEMYLIGSFNSWSQGDANYKMTEKSEGVWTATITITEDMYTSGKAFAELKAFNTLGANDSEKYSAGQNSELTAGTWAIKYDAATNSIQVEEFAYWVVGTFNGANFEIKADVTPKMVAGETAGTFTCEYEITASAKPNYDWIGDDVFALKAVYGTALLGAKDWIGPADNPNGNVMIGELGTYVITVTVTDTGASVAAVKKA